MSAPTETTEPAPDVEPAPARSARAWLSSRRPVLAMLSTAVIALVVVAVVVAGDERPPAPKPDIPLDGWAPYWALDDSLGDFDERVRSMRDVSPFWFNVVGVTDIEVDRNAPEEATEDFISIVRRSDANLVPSLVDALPAGEMAAILADPATRRRHVVALRQFADDGDYDGLDIDYEQFAFADGRSTWEATRPNWVAFVEELAEALHADGRTLTVSIPPVYDDERTADSGFWVYDYGAIAPHVDRIRIMAYDFSVNAAGPIAPLSFVEDAIAGAIEATGSPEKLVLGLPSYGRNWPTFVAGECPPDAPGRTAVTARSIDELVALRGGQPVAVAETGEWIYTYDLVVEDGERSCTQTRQVHYVDADGIRLRMDLAREHRLDGVSLWALGFEDDAVWNAILPTVDDTPASSEPEAD